MSRECNKDITVRLSAYANQSNNLYYQNKLLKTKVTLYQELITRIKFILSLLSPNKTNSNLNMQLVTMLSNDNSSLRKKNRKMNKEIEKIQEQYDSKYKKNKGLFDELEACYDKAKEDSFLLQNTIKEKDYYIKIYKDELTKRKANQYFRDDVKEKYLPYTKNLNLQHKTELEILQSKLVIQSKEHNKEKVTTERLQTQIDTLRAQITEHKIALTERGNYRTCFIERKEQLSNANEIEIDSFLEFDDFEKEPEEESRLDENEVGLIDEKEDNHQRMQTEANIDETEKRQEYLNQRLCTASGPNLNLKSAIPKLNLKQIEFNKIKVYAAFTERKMNPPKGTNTVDYKILKMRHRLQKEKAVNVKYNDIISNFKVHYGKMKQYYKQMLSLVESYDDNNMDKYSYTERINKI